MDALRHTSWQTGRVALRAVLPKALAEAPAGAAARYEMCVARTYVLLQMMGTLDPEQLYARLETCAPPAPL